MGMSHGAVDDVLPRELRGHVVARAGGSLKPACKAPEGSFIIHQSSDVRTTCAGCAARLDAVMGASNDSAALGPLEMDGVGR